jgi:hypothetical protein
MSESVHILEGRIDDLESRFNSLDNKLSVISNDLTILATESRRKSVINYIYLISILVVGALLW